MEESDLYRILKMEDNKNKRLCWIIVLLIVLLCLSVIYTIYLHNDIGVETTTEESYEVQQDSGDNSNNNFITGNENEVNNG